MGSGEAVDLERSYSSEPCVASYEQLVAWRRNKVGKARRVEEVDSILCEMLSIADSSVGKKAVPKSITLLRDFNLICIR